MSLVYGFVHKAAREKCDARALVSELNNFLRSFAQRSERLDHFFSANLFFGVIDPGSLRMHYVNAGHPAGIVCRDDQLLRLPATSHPVGYFERAEFSEEKFQFADNDRLLLYTDGLIDSSNRAGEMFGVDRLVEAFRRLEGDHVVLLDRLFATVETFLAGQPPYDDCTAIVIDFHRSLQDRKEQ
jgi:serine phosphatase RsbU (regulator of sigma subunit)